MRNADKSGVCLSRPLELTSLDDDDDDDDDDGRFNWKPNYVTSTTVPQLRQ